MELKHRVLFQMIFLFNPFQLCDLFGFHMNFPREAQFSVVPLEYSRRFFVDSKVFSNTAKLWECRALRNRPWEIYSTWNTDANTALMTNVWNEVPFPIFFGGFMLTFQGEHPFLLFLAGFFSIQSSSFSSTGIWGLIQQHGLHRFTLFGRQIWAGLVGNIFKKLATLEPRRQSTEFCNCETCLHA